MQERFRCPLFFSVSEEQDVGYRFLLSASEPKPNCWSVLQHCSKYILHFNDQLMNMSSTVYGISNNYAMKYTLESLEVTLLPLLIIEFIVLFMDSSYSVYHCC